MIRLFLLLVTAVVLVACGSLWIASQETAISVQPEVKAIGTATPVNVVLTNTHGVRAFRAFVEQEGKRYPLFEKTQPAVRVLFARTKFPPAMFTFPAGKQQAPALKSGKAKVILEAQSNDFAAQTSTLAFDVDVITQPPRVAADGFQHYINQGGSEMVTFIVSGDWNDAGVKVGDRRFRSFPLPGGAKGERFSFFAYSWDTPEGVEPKVYARNAAGTEATTTFWNKIFPRKFRSRDLDIDDKFLDKVTGQIDPSATGTLIERFLRINRDMRKQNNETLSNLRFKTEEKFLWTEPFLQLGNSKVESQFADRRTYVYQGKKVDEQTHLGFDLSVTQHVPVAAANDGKVVYAADLGIYGNCVVLDHGYGLQSIYAHLSSIAVKEGELVKRSQSLGNSGSTGLAGGDHLHFSMQLDGVQINPVEWWDEHWIHDRVMAKWPAAKH